MNYLIGAIVGATLWRLGGWKWKWVRRYCLPFSIALYNRIKTKKWLSVIIFPLLVGAFSMGYGESKPYWQKFVVGVLWVVPRFIFLGFSWIAFSVPFVFILLFWLSNTPKTSNIFKWHYVEIIVGGLIGASYV